jgi:hypothetical protein
MNAPTQITSTASASMSAAPRVTIIYEDRQSGLRAKRFSDLLNASLDGEPKGDPTCWRSELLVLPEIAEEIDRDSAASEFVILSLRGDTSLTVSAKRWLESWLEGAAGGPAILVAIFDPARSTLAQAESTRCYLRHVTADADVAFFAHCTPAPTCDPDNLLREDEALRARPAGRRRSRKIVTPFFPATAAA